MNCGHGFGFDLNSVGFNLMYLHGLSNYNSNVIEFSAPISKNPIG